MDIADIQQVVVDSAKILSVAYKTKSSVVAAIGFVGPIIDLKSANLSAALAELKSASPDDVLSLEASFKSNIDLGDPAAQANAMEADGFLEEAITLVQQGVMIAEQAIALEENVQAFFASL